ncbi:RNA-directed DNA polymerase from mobile element jockey-like [Brachionus plicatilis]|uniref:RNA-directed DNA polymerase from mobile element jockey-like n=1 Tax=Brachionus plicatilis TaxID=10195 RepID=A0A3M7PLL3_BRAPC|nr:RNA-directed DNA polymerase from mobile element jockey-like [Brachionus plicatilis]
MEETVCRLSTGYEGARFEDEALEGLTDQSLLNTGKSVFISECSSELSCFYANATSLTPEKLEELRSLCIEKTYDVLFIYETWFNELSVNNIEGYECFRKDRSRERGGGVCIYASDSGSFNFTEIDNEQLNSNKIEQIWCVAESGKEKILLECMYRPKIIINSKGVSESEETHKVRNREIIKSIEMANNLVKRWLYSGLLLVGDFNYSELDWSDNLEAKILTETESAAEFVKCLSEGFLTQNVCFKTFQKEPNKLTNILDLIITEAQERMDNLEPGEVLGGKENGHLSMSWRYKLKEKVKEFGYRFRRSNFNYKKGDYIRMNKFFESINWRVDLVDKNIRDSYKKFLKIYNEACERFIPKIKIDANRRIRPPWLTKDLKSLMRRKSN